MKLRNQALQRGTSALISAQTHVENGSKIAKGHDALDGVVSQFSSLMSVMHDDFALMGDLEREYEGEKSEVEPTLPSDPVVARRPTTRQCLRKASMHLYRVLKKTLQILNVITQHCCLIRYHCRCRDDRHPLYFGKRLLW